MLEHERIALQVAIEMVEVNFKVQKELLECKRLSEPYEKEGSGYEAPQELHDRYRKAIDAEKKGIYPRYKEAMKLLDQYNHH